MARRRRERDLSGRGLQPSYRSAGVAGAGWASLAGGPALFPLPLAQIAVVPMYQFGHEIAAENWQAKLTIARTHCAAALALVQSNDPVQCSLSVGQRRPFLDLVFSPSCHGNRPTGADATGSQDNHPGETQIIEQDVT